MAAPFSWQQVNIRPSQANPSHIDPTTASCKGASGAEMVAGRVEAAGEATLERNNFREVERY